jgi:hypothetical protein
MDYQDSTTSPPLTPPACPLCGGQVYELRGLLRCARCSFTLCDGCCGNEPVIALED